MAATITGTSAATRPAPWPWCRRAGRSCGTATRAGGRGCRNVSTGWRGGGRCAPWPGRRSPSCACRAAVRRSSPGRAVAMWTLLRGSRRDRVGPRTGPGGRVVKSPEERERGKGHGNWACWLPEELGTLLDAAADWARQLPPGDRYWLCWNVNDAWCRLQQRLVREAGWTPVVGGDPNRPAPTVLDGSVSIDFNRALGLNSVWLHVPLELAFAWAGVRLAFWHADVLLPRPLLRRYARQFEAMTGAVTAAVYCRHSV